LLVTVLFPLDLAHIGEGGGAHCLDLREGTHFALDIS
jgi:hypothetical protein